ncbi:hypothetical protein [Lapidilactobacillus gannanensis]|jgi:hypothetical protein|uniref:hypothetical protein n=1 Tax=Lapidilactobacillus gannanensis TaxID=2486002 RepID=UPI002AE7870C|nr:hypothetical protein [Lactobacillaceae bacterium]
MRRFSKLIVWRWRLQWLINFLALFPIIQWLSPIVYRGGNLGYASLVDVLLIFSAAIVAYMFTNWVTGRNNDDN